MAASSLTAGVNPKVVSERLGHATVSFTLDTYLHVLPRLQEDAAEKVAVVIGLQSAPRLHAADQEVPANPQAPLPGFEPGFPD